MYYIRKFTSSTDYDNLDAYYPCLSVVITTSPSAIVSSIKDVKDYMWYCYNDDFGLITGKGDSDWNSHHNSNTDYLIDYHPRYGFGTFTRPNNLPVICVGRWF